MEGPAIPTPDAGPDADPELLFSAVLLTLHEMIWADGSVDPNEVVVAAVVAREILGKDIDFKRIVPVLKRPERPPVVDLGALPENARLMLLTAAVEIVKADGVVEDAELEAVRELGKALRLQDAEGRIAEALAAGDSVADRWEGR
jgi:uncharacterized tellurite resistance protein B-like protein